MKAKGGWRKLIAVAKGLELLGKISKLHKEYQDKLKISNR